MNTQMFATNVVEIYKTGFSLSSIFFGRGEKIYHGEKGLFIFLIYPQENSMSSVPRKKFGQPNDFFNSVVLLQFNQSCLVKNVQTEQTNRTYDRHNTRRFDFKPASEK